MRSESDNKVSSENPYASRGGRLAQEPTSQRALLQQPSALCIGVYLASLMIVVLRFGLLAHGSGAFPRIFGKNNSAVNVLLETMMHYGSLMCAFLGLTLAGACMFRGTFSTRLLCIPPTLWLLSFLYRLFT